MFGVLGYFLSLRMGIKAAEPPPNWVIGQGAFPLPFSCGGVAGSDSGPVSSENNVRISGLGGRS